MFQISSYGRCAGKTICDDDFLNNSYNNNYSIKRKSPYDVLLMMSKWSIFCYHLRSFLIGLWILIKWLFQCLWHLIQQYTSKHSKHNSSNDCYLHDKPPPCLVDNRIGLQSYVKLKVKKNRFFLMLLMLYRMR